MINFEEIDWNVSDSIKILVTKKSFSPKKDFNISFSGKNKYEETKKNIDFLTDNFLPSEPYFIKQIHGEKVIDLDRNIFQSYVADGLVTSKKKQVISILTADCMPIVISSICGSIICVLHVGRKGLEFNIIESAFKILKNYNYSFEAWIGPSISKDYYLVDESIKKIFVSIDKKYEEFFLKNSNNLHMDLSGIATYQLKKNNVNNIYYSGLCTVKDCKDLYSFRKFSDEKRFGTFVWIE
ncbi:MAG: peptidoglycan editing factor PgeF [Gammaproteobacteria bacterium]|jgi:polyphenol oxidase|nr:peptidoglycan editing factor PgeF [Gammaproteobacteria bacterium]MBT6754684.1 peptidoglycan editing factor PgeF [Gammaproteobacteria bacterium]MBT7523118.1 peptidoglycan editing factor PgeF [Gammaproteobacteria bacterium]MBT7814341.1 peptidoglycan editing factor PgeF [Gammaproteobacteria bacterium]